MEMPGAPGDLLEREDELERIGALIAAAAAGQGQLVIIEGEAGMGKTALLERACLLAAERGLLVLRARGGELEREFPHGVVRQLFEGHLRELPEAQAASLLSGTAELAAPIVAPSGGSSGERAGADPFSVLHGLYWLTANLAEVRPLLLAVDDVQWSDRVSMQFLAHLARRMEGVPVMLCACLRSGEPTGNGPFTGELAAQPGAEVAHLPPLSEEAVGKIIATRLGEKPDPEFARACRRATGGTPFLVGELVTELGAKGVRPRRGSVRAVDDVVPQSVARFILLRLERLPAPAGEVARAVAVLGADAQLHRAASLAGVDEADALRATEALTATGIFRPGLPLEFAHPIVREAVYDNMVPAGRAAAHARAAELLAAERAEIDAVAGHLLLTEPAGRADIVRMLQEAADHAAERGAPEAAVVYLRRALDEGGVDEEGRAGLLRGLGRAERNHDGPSAMRHLRVARDVSRDPLRRAQITYDLADAMFYRPGWREVVPVVDAAIEELGELDLELSGRLEALRVAGAFHDGTLLVDALSLLPKLEELARSPRRAARLAAALCASLRAWMSRPAGEVDEMLRIAMPGGRLALHEDPESWVYQHVFHGLGLTDQLDRLAQATEELAAEGRRRGSRGGLAGSLAHLAWAHTRSGDLVSAEAVARASAKLIGEHDLGIGDLSLSWYLTDLLIERPSVDDMAQRVLGRSLRPIEDNLITAFVHLETRGRIRLAKGQFGPAIEDLSRCAAMPYAFGNPNGCSWRPALALAFKGEQPDRARELADAELEAARRAGLPRGIGVAHRTLGLVEGGEEGLASLEEAVHVLGPSPARLELARSLVELGAARRRSGQRVAAREPLSAGLDLAHRCGAVRLEERARAELVATGARPRRAMLTGREALTATEQRIAGMAAEGLSNPEIAQALFVTRKNVENHLGRVYPKLGISSREQLADALGGEDDQR